MAAIEVKTKGFDKAIADQDRLNKTAEKHGKALNASAQEAQRSAAVLQRIMRDNETAQERYSRKMREARVALAGHAQEVEQLARLENRLQRELFETSQEYREGLKLAREMDEDQKKRAEAAVKREMEKSARIRRLMDDDARQAKRIADEQLTAEDRLYNAERRLMDLKRRGAISDKQFAREQKRIQDDYQKELDETRGKLEEVGKSSTSAFDASRIVRWGAAIVGPSALLVKTLGSLRDIRQEQEALANKSTNESRSAGALVQLAGSDAAKRDELFAAADATYGEGYARDRQEAYGLTFELGSADLLNERRFFSQLSAIDDSAALAKSYGLIRQGFSGGDDIGNAQAVVGKSIAAALPATGVSPSQIGEGVALSSASAQAFGLTDEELFAAVSRVSEITGSGSEAGTSVNAILTSLINRGYADRLKGQGLEAVISEISKMGLDEAGTVAEFGDRNAYKAFNVLRDQGAYRQRIQEIRDAESSNLAQVSIDNALGSERIASAVAKRSGEALNVLSQDEIAQGRARAEGRADRSEATRREGGSSELNNRLNRFGEETWRFFFGDSGAATADRRREKFSKVVGEGAEGMTDLEIFAAALNRMAASSEKTAENTGKLVDKDSMAAIPVR